MTTQSVSIEEEVERELEVHRVNGFGAGEWHYADIAGNVVPKPYVHALISSRQREKKLESDLARYKEAVDFEKEVYLCWQPNGAVYVTENRPDTAHDDGWLTDDVTHEFLVVRNNFSLTKKHRIVKANLSLTALSQIPKE